LSAKQPENKLLLEKKSAMKRIQVTTGCLGLSLHGYSKR
jgi:hypothetical protein